ncbi:MAG TPA: aspartate--tRNA ligase [Thermoleophilia bacterium]
MRYRDQWCGEVGEELVGQQAKVAGWVQRRRDHGGLVFVDLRDRTGLVQLVFEAESNAAVHQLVQEVRPEFVLSASGIVVARSADRVNPNMTTGRVEIIAGSLEVLAASKTPPFYPEDELDVDETLRLKYRYIDLRRPRMFRNLALRNRAVQAVRRYLGDEGFIEVETPILTKSTPEGARDFLVPSRMQPGQFYALPQSPQLFKQLLMISGFERYFQMAPCFRDEDLRADRQPEFAQIDLEMSFIEELDVQNVIEGVIRAAWKEALDVELTPPFPRLTYAEAMARYGSDKPDVRFAMELVDVTDVAAKADFRVFAETVARGGVVRGLRAQGGSRLSRKDVEDLAAQAAVFGAQGVLPVWVEEEGLRSPFAKFVGPEIMAELVSRLSARAGDLMVFVADRTPVVEASLSALRLALAERLGVERTGWAFVWIVDPPMFEYDEKEGRLKAQHHPFTMPRLDRVEDLKEKPLELGTYAYDLVLNGVELGSGSIRIANPAVQEAVFEALGMTEEQAKAKFGFLVEAMDYGIPPHGGMALGLDRIIMLMTGESSIRDVIAFPKTQSGSCPLTGAPSSVAADQLKELRIRTT